MEKMTLRDLEIGKTATIASVGGEGALRQHLLDMGLIKGADVTVVKYAPMGDPIELRVHGYELTIRLDDAAKIDITDIRVEKEEHKSFERHIMEHPGYGEGGRFHDKTDEHPLPEGTVLSFALIGNQSVLQYQHPPGCVV